MTRNNSLSDEEILAREEPCYFILPCAVPDRPHKDGHPCGIPRFRHNDKRLGHVFRKEVVYVGDE